MIHKVWQLKGGEIVQHSANILNSKRRRQMLIGRFSAAKDILKSVHHLNIPKEKRI